MPTPVQAPTFLGLDLGTTHCKAGLFDAAGALIALASRHTATYRTARGHLATAPRYPPGRMWEAAAGAIEEVAAAAGGPIEMVGVSGMAEAGLLVDRASGRARTHIIPWHDTRSTPQAERIAREDSALELLRRSGLYPSFKHGLAKLLWLRERDPAIAEGAVWLSVPDYIVFRLTGRMVTDPTLAARTFAFRIREGCWDTEWIRHFGLAPDNFPEVLPSGTPAGNVREGAGVPGLTSASRAAVAGHDHICTLPAVGIVEPGDVLDSVGTAESMLGMLDGLEIGKGEMASGLSFVPHVLPGRYCWLGGLSAAGGSLEWFRAQLAEDPLPYDQLLALAREGGPDPTEILYFPYLSGSGAPCPDQRVRAAFVGLSASHGRAHLARAVLEGTAYEAESIRRTAERLTGRPIRELIVVGGGARNREWLQIRADVLGCSCLVPDLPEATVLGAALTAALGSGMYAGIGEVTGAARRHRDAGATVRPDPARHEIYQHIYETGYLSLQAPLRRYGARPERNGTP